MANNAMGFFIIDKPAGPTSHDVVAHVRRTIGQKSVGHTGTLDPFATGILLVPVGPATRLVEYTRELPKTYVATLALGATTETDDYTSNKLASLSARQPEIQEIQNALQKFIGTIEQTPPRYAAIKVAGKKLYEYAREGKEVERKPRSVTIHSLELVDYAYPNLTIKTMVSSGTYIRALARDIGETLNTGAYLSSLRRTAIGVFTEKRATALEGVTAGNWPGFSHPTKELVAHLPQITLGPTSVAQLQQGRIILAGQPVSGSASQPIAILDQRNHLIGIALYQPSTNSLLPKTILAYNV